MAGRIGIDEAGRGPVLGSMFVAAVAVPAAVEVPEDVADSKRLEPDHRRELATRLEHHPDVEIAVAEVSSDDIDGAPGELNTLLVGAVIDCLQVLGRTDWEVILDAGEADVDRYVRRISAGLDADRTLHARVRADATVPIVSAASIVAKEHRERHVEQLRSRYGEVGSGYPGDQTTRTFLAEHVAESGELPACARRCWQTSRDVMAAAEQSDLDRFVDG